MTKRSTGASSINMPSARWLIARPWLFYRKEWERRQFELLDEVVDRLEKVRLVSHPEVEKAIIDLELNDYRRTSSSASGGC